MNDTLDYAGQAEPYSGSSGAIGGSIGLPPVEAWSSGSIASSEIDPSPNQVRRSKRQPMAELSSVTSTPSPVPQAASRSGADRAPATPVQQQRSLSVSLGNSPSHLSRSPRMGRKSLRNFHNQQQPAQQPNSPPLYENQSYPPLENLSLNESTRSRSGSEPSIYVSRSEQAQERHDSTPKTSAVRLATISSCLLPSCFFFSCFVS